MSKERNRTYKQILNKQEQQNRKLEELENSLEETNKKLEEMTSLLKVIVVNYLLDDLEKTI